MAAATITRKLDFERATKRFARYRARPQGDDEEPDVGVLYVRLDALDAIETPMQSSFELTLTPTEYVPQAASGKVAA